MIIGFDAKRAVSNMTGLGNYSRYAIATMAEAYPDNEYRLYAPKQKENPRLKHILEQKNTSLFVPDAPWSKLGSLWRSLEITNNLLSHDVSLFHGLSNELPLNISRSGIPSVVTIHDVIWRRVPKDYTAIDRKLYDFKYGLSAKNATRIIAISECTKRDIIADFGIDPEKIDVVYQGCDPQFNRRVTMSEREAIVKKYNLPPLFIACVGTVQSRKNQLLAVKALRALPEDVKLVIVGRNTSPYAKEIAAYISKHHLSQRVIWIDSMPFADLPALYAAACLSAYPSRYEGFGLPVIESISVGTPVIAATGSCLEEAGGKGAIYVDPDNEEEFAAYALKIIEDKYFHDKLASLGAQHAKKFTASEFAKRTMASYIRAIMAST